MANLEVREGLFAPLDSHPYYASVSQTSSSVCEIFHTLICRELSSALSKVLRRSLDLLVEDNIYEGAVNLQSAVVVNEAQLPELIHKEINAFARHPCHFRQSSLIYIRNDRFGVAFLTVAGQQQKSSGQPFLAGVEKLIDQVLLDAHIA